MIKSFFTNIISSCARFRVLDASGVVLGPALQPDLLFEGALGDYPRFPSQHEAPEVQGLAVVDGDHRVVPDVGDLVGACEFLMTWDGNRVLDFFFFFVVHKEQVFMQYARVNSFSYRM